MHGGKISEAKMAIKTLFRKQRVDEVLDDLTATAQGSCEPEVGRPYISPMLTG